MFAHTPDSEDRHAPSASNVEERENGSHHDEYAQRPSFTGPGEHATAAAPKPHSSKLLNKLDPRFDEDVLEEANKVKKQEKKEEEEFGRRLSGKDTAEEQVKSK